MSLTKHEVTTIERIDDTEGRKDVHTDIEEATPKRLEDVIPKLDKYWFQYGWFLRLNLFLAGSLFSLVTSGYDGSMMNSLQTLPSWQEYFDHPTGSILSTMSNGLPIGCLIATPFAWYVCDRLGRKYTIIVGCVVICIGAALQGAAQNFGMFTAARILLGMGTCLSSVASAPLLAETSYPSQRPILTGFLLASWPFGSFIAALVTWGPYHSSMKYNNWSWRIPSILQCFFPLLQIGLVYFGPESPRWLINRGREEEARRFFVKYHAGGDEASELVAFEIAEIKAVIEQESVQKTSKFSDWVSSKQRLKRFFIVCAVPAMQQLCGNALVSYYLVLVLNSIGYTNTNDQLNINIGVTVYQMGWCVFAGLTVDMLRRKTIFLIAFGSMCLSFVLWTILSALNEQQNFENKALGRGVLAMIFLFSGFYSLLPPISMTYVMEVCPFHLRAQGSTIYQLSGNGAQFFNNYVNNVALEAIGWRYYIVWCIWLAVLMNVVYWIFPETKGLGLEEVAIVFGEDVSKGIEEAGNAIQKRDKEKKVDSYDYEDHRD